MRANSRQPTAKKIRELSQDISDWRRGWAGVSTVHKAHYGSHESKVQRKSDQEILDEVEKRLLQIAQEAEDG